MLTSRDHHELLPTDAAISQDINQKSDCLLHLMSDSLLDPESRRGAAVNKLNMVLCLQSIHVFILIDRFAWLACRWWGR